MSIEVDTREVRRAAQEIRRVAGSVMELSERNVASMQGDVAEYMEGETADALLEVLNQLSADIQKVATGLFEVQRALEAYAKRIDEADEKAKRMIDGE